MGRQWARRDDGHSATHTALIQYQRTNDSESRSSAMVKMFLLVLGTSLLNSTYPA